jgi:type IV secretion system protein VirB11
MDIEALVLENALAPLAKWYRLDYAEEICINRPGEVWIKTGASDWEVHEDPELTESNILLACEMLANRTSRPFDVIRNPLLYCETKPESYRFTAIVGTSVVYNLTDTQGVCLAVRRQTDKVRDLGDWGLHQDTKELNSNKHAKAKERHSEIIREDLIESVRKDGSVLISGATSTGKTNFLRALIEAIPSHYRVVTVEDSKEIYVPHKNRLHFLVNRIETEDNPVTWRSLLDGVKRLTPDVIIAGEVSTANGAVIYNMLNTGHRFLTTIHANTTKDAVRALFQNVVYTNPAADFEATCELIEKSFSRIVQIDNIEGKRLVTDVMIPQDLSSNVHQNEFEAWRHQAQQGGAAQADPNAPPESTMAGYPHHPQAIPPQQGGYYMQHPGYGQPMGYPQNGHMPQSHPGQHMPQQHTAAPPQHQPGYAPQYPPQPPVAQHAPQGYGHPYPMQQNPYPHHAPVAQPQGQQGQIQGHPQQQHVPPQYAPVPPQAPPQHQHPAPAAMPTQPQNPHPDLSRAHLPPHAPHSTGGAPQPPQGYPAQQPPHQTPHLGLTASPPQAAARQPQPPTQPHHAPPTQQHPAAHGQPQQPPTRPMPQPQAAPQQQRPQPAPSQYPQPPHYPGQPPHQ